jgi:hypothetical protein
MAKVFLTQNGDKCDSDYERAVVDDLIDRGISYEYETARFDYSTPVTKGHCEACGEQSKRVVQRRYRTLDITLPNGIVVEVKGKFPSPIRTLMRHIVRCNSGADIRMIFMRDNWLVAKTKKRKYSDWCRTVGIPCAVGDPRENPGTIAYGVGGIPQEWIDE